MGRKRLPESERKIFVGIRLPKWLLDLVKKDGKEQDVIEETLKMKYQEKKD